MAEAVLFTLTNDILNLVGIYIFSKIQLVGGASDDLKGLKHTVETIQTMLLDAEKKQWDSKQVKLWLMRLKDVLYDAQDLLDDVATEDLRRKVTPDNKISKAIRLTFPKSNQRAQPYKVVKRIQEIRKKLDRIEQDRKFRLEELQSEATVATVRRTTGFFVQKEEIIGRESDKTQIIAYLVNSSSQESVSVVCIVGMGGLGKTTLARLAYNDDQVRNHFELKMWVCVSHVFDVDFLIKEILKSAQDEYQGDRKMMKKLQGIENKSKGLLPKLLCEVLDGKKYLLVLDDMWNEDRGKWLELRGLLMGCSLGSKIIITTRNQSVVRAIGTKSAIYHLDVLSKGDSWDLFKRLAFEDGEESSNQKKLEMGQDIVKKCGGVPLAIKTIGHLLFSQGEEEWLHFKDAELSKIDQVNSDILEVLKLSYNYLSAGLKHCFAYCALFPKDHVFDKQTMIQLWMAQGYIESLDGNEKLEEIGDNYVLDLLYRSFLEVVEVNDHTSEVKLFKMHDLMHDLALKVAGNECKMISLNKVSLNEYTRHVSFPLQSSSSLQEVTSLLEAINLRTFLSLGRRPYLERRPSVQKLSRKEYHEIFSKFKHCRTLVLDYANFYIPPESQLNHLRYLEVFENEYIKSLPDLMNLQTLKLSKCKNLKTFPRDVRKLVNLRYLLIDECDSLSHLPPLSELPSLKALILAGLNALELLEQTSDPQQSNTTHVFFPSLERLSVLNCSNLKEWCGGRQLMGAYQKHQPDNSRSFFPKLWSVEIWGCPKLNFMPPFPHIEYLDIDSKKILEQWLADPNYLSKAAVGSTIIPFSKLKLLNLNARGLEHSVLESLFQRARHLKSMKLYGCNLRSLSCGMRYLSSLQELNLCNCEELDLADQEDNHGTQWRFLVELRALQITQLPESVALPEGIQYIPNLHYLEISHCGYLKILPQWLEKMSLEEVAIISCPSLEDTTMLWRLKAKRKSTTNVVRVTKEMFFDSMRNLRASGSSSVQIDDSLQIDDGEYSGKSHLKVAIRIHN